MRSMLRPERSVPFGKVISSVSIAVAKVPVDSIRRPSRSNWLRMFRLWSWRTNQLRGRFALS